MGRSLFLLVLLAFLCVGCIASGTATVNKGRELLAASSGVVGSFRELPYEEIGFGEGSEFAFDEKALVIKVGDSRRFAKGFVLPAAKGPYSVSITSYKMGILRDPAIMYPEVTLLDSDFGVVRRIPYSSFVFRPSRPRDGLNTVFFINGLPRRERFLLITNRPAEEADLMVTQSNISSTTAVVVVTAGVCAVWMVPMGTSTPPMKMKASAIGDFSVRLEEYRPRKVGQ